MTRIFLIIALLIGGKPISYSQNTVPVATPSTGNVGDIVFDATKGAILYFRYVTATISHSITRLEREKSDRVKLYDYLYRGVTHLNLKNYDKVLADLIKQTEPFENLADTYYYIGEVYTKMNNLQKAKENYTIAYDKYVKGNFRKDPCCEPLDKVWLVDIEEKLKQ